MPRFKRFIFYQYSPKIKLFLKKNAKFSSAGGSASKPPKQPPPNGEFLATRLPHFCNVYNYMGFVAFVLNNFFLIVQLQTL